MLKDIVIAEATVSLPDSPDGEKQEFKVRGLTLTDIGNLVNGYYEAIDGLMENTLTPQQIATEFPEFLAVAVACAAGEPDEAETIKRLPIGVQLDAFEKCWDLTIPDYAALEKLVVRIKGLIPKLQAKPE